MARSGLVVAVAGLMVGGLAAIAFVMDWNPYPANHTGGAGLGFALFLIFGAILGFIIMMVGLILAALGALTNRPGKAP